MSSTTSKASINTELIKARWNSFKLYNGYRILIALTLLLSHSAINSTSLTAAYETADSFSIIAAIYLLFSIICAIFTWLEKPKLEITLPVQILCDIIFILLLVYADGANHSGIGFLLVITIAAASLISEGRLALFYAAVATLGILLGQFFSSILNPRSSENFTAAVMLSIACFAIAWLAHSLAKRMQQSELLASQRSLDLQNLAQVNALIADKMVDGVLVVDHDLIVQHHNIQSEAFLGIEKQHNADKHLEKISPEIAKLYTEWSNGQQHSETVLSNITKVNIASRELRVSFLPISENDNQGAVIFIEDWSQMQTQSHQVKLAALGRLTANIAHEIRNPLSAIGHANQLMQEEDEITPYQKRMLEIIGDNVLRLDQIIKDVLELNRRDRTNQEFIHLESFITDFYNQFCAVENISNKDFNLNIENNDTSILFDRRHLNQILWNLCKNGWRHSKQAGNSLNLNLYLTNSASVVNIEVRNDGEGIPEKVSNHLFEPFFTTEKTGTGLGLYIGRELAEANGANLQYKPDKNETIFTMLIKKAVV